MLSADVHVRFFAFGSSLLCANSSNERCDKCVVVRKTKPKIKSNENAKSVSRILIFLSRESVISKITEIGDDSNRMLFAIEI